MTDPKDPTPPRFVAIQGRRFATPPPPGTAVPMIAGLAPADMVIPGGVRIGSRDHAAWIASALQRWPVFAAEADFVTTTALHRFLERHSSRFEDLLDNRVQVRLAVMVLLAYAVDADEDPGYCLTWPLRNDVDAGRRRELDALNSERSAQEIWATQVRRAVALLEWPAFLEAYGAERDALAARGHIEPVTRDPHEPMSLEDLIGMTSPAWDLYERWTDIREEPREDRYHSEVHAAAARLLGRARLGPYWSEGVVSLLVRPWPDTMWNFWSEHMRPFFPRDALMSFVALPIAASCCRGSGDRNSAAYSSSSSMRGGVVPATTGATCRTPRSFNAAASASQDVGSCPIASSRGSVLPSGAGATGLRCLDRGALETRAGLPVGTGDCPPSTVYPRVRCRRPCSTVPRPRAWSFFAQLSSADLLVWISHGDRLISWRAACAVGNPIPCVRWAASFPGFGSAAANADLRARWMGFGACA